MEIMNNKVKQRYINLVKEGYYLKQGLQGIQGFIGVQGNQGRQGNQGTIGIQGNQGSQGNQGIIGVQGNQGRQGWQGIVGSQGNQGFIGLQGRQGYQGNQGIQGFVGLQGSQGIQGVQGLTGPQGIGGTPGILGYEITLNMVSGYPDSIFSAYVSNGTMLHDGSSWVEDGWSNDPIGNLSDNYLVKIYHPLNTKVLNMTTHGVNGNNIYSISVYGKSQAATQYCTLVQGLTFSYFSL